MYYEYINKGIREVYLVLMDYGKQIDWICYSDDGFCIINNKVNIEEHIEEIEKFCGKYDLVFE